MEYFELNNGNKVPALCFGPGIMTRGYKFHNNIAGKILDRIKIKKLESHYFKAILSAIENGFRFFDYSATYQREDLIHRAIKESGIPREEFILTTRIPNSAQYGNKVEEVFKQSLDKFQTNYIDILMFHWPVPDKYISTWETLIKLKEKGLCTNIGVANCHAHHLDLLIKETGVTPQINQVEIHPLFSQIGLRKYCHTKEIQLQAYTSLARMDERMCRLPRIKALCKKYDKTIAQVILRWHIQHGIIPIFRSLNNIRQKENIQIFDFKLSPEDMAYIDSININSRLRYDPDNCDFSIL